ncbi:hypothetical protein Tco_0601509 [Tanacetum coccineum]
MANRENTTTGKDWRRRTLHFGLDEFRGSLGMLKLPVEGGVITLKSSRMVPLECAMVSGPKRNLSATKQTMEERFKVEINPEYSEQTIMISSTLTEEGCNKLCDLL